MIRWDLWKKIDDAHYLFGPSYSIHLVPRGVKFYFQPLMLDDCHRVWGIHNYDHIYRYNAILDKYLDECQKLQFSY